MAASATHRVPLREVWGQRARAGWALMLPVLILVGLRFRGVHADGGRRRGRRLCRLSGDGDLPGAWLAGPGPIVVESLAATAVVMAHPGHRERTHVALTWERVSDEDGSGALLGVRQSLLILLLLNILLLFLGCVMEGTAILIILTPILVPVITKLGIDPVHFGLVFVINLTIGAVTPPVGTILYTVCSIVGVSVEEFTKETLAVPSSPW